MKTKDKYINFSIVILKDVFNGEKTKEVFLSEVIAFGVYECFLKIYNSENFHYDEITAFRQAIKFYNLNILATAEKLIEFSEIFERYQSNKIKTGLKLDVLLDYYQNNKDLYQIQVLVVFLALKSILGNSFVSKTTNNFLFSRIAGLENIKEYENHLPNLTPYLLRRIKDDLQVFWQVNIAKSKGFFFSIGSDLTKFYVEVAKRKKTAKEKFLKDKKQTAKIQAQKILDGKN